MQPHVFGAVSDEEHADGEDDEQQEDAKELVGLLPVEEFEEEGGSGDKGHATDGAAAVNEAEGEAASLEEPGADDFGEGRTCGEGESDTHDGENGEELHQGLDVGQEEERRADDGDADEGDGLGAVPVGEVSAHGSEEAGEHEGGAKGSGKDGAAPSEVLGHGLEEDAKGEVAAGGAKDDEGAGEGDNPAIVEVGALKQHHGKAILESGGGDDNGERGRAEGIPARFFTALRSVQNGSRGESIGSRW